MSKEEIFIGMLLLRSKVDYSYVLMRKDGNNISYEVIEPSEVEE